jgi:hypothetical protein
MTETEREKLLSTLDTLLLAATRVLARLDRAHLCAKVEGAQVEGEDWTWYLEIKGCPTEWG